MPKKKLGEVLVELGIINQDQLHAALEYSKKWRKKLGQSLVENHFITEAQLLGALSSHLGIPAVDLSKIDVTETLLKTISPDFAQKHEVFPAGIGHEGSRSILKVAMSDPTNVNAVTEIEFATGHKVQPVLAEISQITHMIRKHYLKIDLEPLNIGSEASDTKSRRFPAGMNVVDGGKVTKAGTGQFEVVHEDSRQPAAAFTKRPPSGLMPQSSTPAPVSASSPKDSSAAKAGDDAGTVDTKLMALLKLLIEKKVITKEEYLAELQILLARKGPR